MRNDNLEHGWIVDSIDNSDAEIIIHCHCCWKIITDSKYKYQGFGKYICKNCLKEQCDE